MKTINPARFAVALLLVMIASIAACSSEVSYHQRQDAEIQGFIHRGAQQSGRLASGAPLVLEGPIDEVWIVARGAPTIAAPRDDAPGTGSLVSCERDRDGLPTRAFPLQDTRVDARITGPVASVEVGQRFFNPYGDTIEAAYVFPLPHDAAVSDFVLRVGDRMIRGLVREREEAEEIYRDARSAGYVASLLSEERPNVFMEQVANIEPGASIDVTLTYFNVVAYDDGWYEWRFPLVVGPRFNPPGTGDGIGAVGVGGSRASGESTNVEYLRPGQSTRRGVQIDVAIDAGVPIRELLSSTHQIAAAPPDSSHASVHFAGDERAMNRDFVLRYRVAGEEEQAGLVSSMSSDGDGYFALTLYPPQTVRERYRAPVDIVFVIDRSGSMQGRPLQLVKEAMRAALAKLRRGDRFSIVDFGDEADALANGMMPVNEQTLDEARRYVDALDARGGTMMMRGLNAALALPDDEGRVRYLAFLTDGFISNEAEIIGALHRSLGGRRVFAFGIGSTANWYLLETMASAGRGAAADISASGDARETMDAFIDRVASPIVHDVKLSFEGVDVDDVWPRRVPDLIVGKPVTVFGRYHGGGATRVALHAWNGGERVERGWTLDFARDPRSAALERVWARACIAQLSDDSTWQTGRAYEIKCDIINTALRYGIASPYTSFVAVDGSRVTSGTNRRTIVQPVPMPEGVRYDTTVDERGH